MDSVQHLRNLPSISGSSYRDGRRSRFSKTARSHPRHHEACGNGRHAPSLTEVRRRLAHDVVKGPAECAQAAEPDIEADICDAAIRRTQEEHRALDASALQIAVRCLAERLAKGANEVGFRN